MTLQKKDMNKKELREFAIITGAIVAGLFGVLLPWLLHRPYPVWPWYVMAILFAMAAVAPMGLKPIYRVWMSFGLVMGWINSRIILGVVFFVIFTPIAMFLKLLGKDPLRRQRDSKTGSYRIESKCSPREQMEKPF